MQKKRKNRKNIEKETLNTIVFFCIHANNNTLRGIFVYLLRYKHPFLIIILILFLIRENERFCLFPGNRFEKQENNETKISQRILFFTC